MTEREERERRERGKEGGEGGREGGRRQDARLKNISH